MLSNEYLAGLFDGEGCVHLGFHNKKSPKTVDLTIHIANTNREIIELLKLEIGGAVRPNNRRRPRDKPAFRWVACASLALSFLQRVQPFAIIKREHIRNALAWHNFQNCRGGGRRVSPEELEHRQEVVALMYKLNKRGFIGPT